MFIKSLRVAVVALTVCVANAWASPTSFEGTVKAPNGQPVSNAEIRIEAKDGSKFSKAVKTDGKGQYVCNGLAEGTFRVTLVLNGAVKATYNAATKLGETTKLNFALKAEAGAKGKATHMVYMPAETGSHLGGRWVEVDDVTGKPNAAGADNVVKGGASMLKGMQSGSGMAPNGSGGH
jgi:carboxypeptidase family protein